MNKLLFMCFFLVFSLHGEAKDIKYNINDLMTITVSDEMELRKDDDVYTKWLNNELKCTPSDEKPIVFQQKGLAEMKAGSRDTFCRIMISTITDADENFPPAYLHDFPEDFLEELKNSASGELAPGMNFISGPFVTVLRSPNGFYYVKVHYTRTGVRGEVNADLLYFYNSKYATRVLCSYHMGDAIKWGPIVEKALRSLKWNEILDSSTPDYPETQQANIIESREKNGCEKADLLIFLFGILSGAVIAFCIIVVYKKYKEKQEIERKSSIEEAIRYAKKLITNDELDKTDKFIRNIKKLCEDRDSEQLGQVETLEKQVAQRIENIAIETKKVVEKYKESVKDGNSSQIESSKKEVENVLKSNLPVRIKDEIRSEIKVINDEYQHGFIPEQEILQTAYPVPNVKRQEGYYCFSLFPKTGTTVFPYRRRRVEMRGYTETGFENKLRTGLADLKNYKVLGDVSILPVDGVHPYEPDIAIIERENRLGIRVDIEIDEPYSGYEQKAIHFIGCGDEYRDANLCNLGWIVIRFSEKQVFTEAEKCVGYVRHILSLIDSALSESNFVSPQADKRWTSTEAVIMAAKGYRESYLHHKFGKSEDSEEAKLTRSDVKQTELEKEAAKHIQTVALPQNKILNIDKSPTEYGLDNRLAFEPKEHIYILDGVLRLKAVSDVVAHFFHPFDILEQSERYAYKNGMSQTEVIEMWDAKGVESRDVGTFLHEQIENHLKGNSVSFDYPFEYDGEIINYRKTVSIETEFGYFLDFMRESGIMPFRSEWRIFDERNKIAGTIDLICRNGSQFDIYDWKRSLKASPNATVWQHGTNGLEHVPDISFYRYALQQNLYKYILENNYGVRINKMYLVVLHREYGRYVKHEVSQMDKEISIILKSL